MKKEERNIIERLERLEEKINSWEDKATTIIAALIVIGVIILAVYLIWIFLVPWLSSAGKITSEWYANLDSNTQGKVDGFAYGIFITVGTGVLLRIFGDAM